MEQTLHHTILQQFDFEGELRNVRAFGDGHINDTFAVTTVGEETPDYVLQRINTNVFLDAAALMDNMHHVTSYLEEQIHKEPSSRWQTLHLIPTHEGKLYHFAEDGSCWRMYRQIGNAESFSQADDRNVLFEAALAFGKFVELLDGYPAETLYETIASFHDTESRYRALCDAVKADPCHRLSEVEAEVAFVDRRKEEIPLLNRLRDRGELPIRVTHNDTKLNNVLFSRDTGESVCVIDLDTVMPGLLAFDYGDAIRFGANRAKEDETDLSLVGIDLDRFTAFTEGFLHYGKGAITKKEVETLPFAARIMTLECGMRFLTDYLNGDVYFKTSHPKHNLERAKNQFRLVEDMEAHADEMLRIVMDVAKARGIL